jgi:NADH-quinone oxidoreductase subunit J
LETLVFYCLAASILGLALVVVTTTRILRAVVALFLALAGVSGLYFLLRAPMLGALQLMVYAGGIAVLFAFAVMLVRSIAGSYVRHTTGYAWPGALIGAAFVLLLAVVWAAQLAGDPETGGGSAIAADLTQRVTDTGLPAEIDPKEGFSPLLIREYVIPFEIASVLLLVAMVGAVLIAHPLGRAHHEETRTVEREGTDVVTAQQSPEVDAAEPKAGGGDGH